MSNLVVIPSNKEDINKILNKDIKGIILGIKSLSIYPLELDIDSIIEIKNNTDKKVYVIINKMIHNNDLDIVRNVLNKINNSNIDGIIFYDLGVFNIIKKMNINKELILSMEHLNASINSHLFYKKRGITGSIVTNDITYKEVLDIKSNTNMNIFYTVYGYLPIFYSRRSLITNYFKYIDKEKHDNRYYIFNNDLRYMVIEHNYGTIIYSPLVNLLNKKEELNILDNLVIDLSYTDNYDIIDKYINNEKEDGYIGFYDTKTIYRLKGDKNE